MKIQILHERDPDSSCSIRVWLDGVEVSDFEIEDIDPGAGYSAEDWEQRLDSVSGDDDFSGDVRVALNQAAGSPYVG